MITIPLWMRAVDTQLEAIAFCDRFNSRRTNGIPYAGPSEHVSLFSGLSPWLKSSRPFGWSADSIQAVLEASASIPDDTVLNRHNLGEAKIFWWFERPLHVPDRETSEVQAISGGWGSHQGHYFFLVTVWYRGETHLIPGHVWRWQENEGILDPLNHANMMFRNVSEERRRQALDAVSKISKFILAASAWLNQKILNVTEEHGERHARKRYQKIVKQWHPVLIVHLRKREYQSSGSAADESHASPSYRFVVNGHWRNQPCGPSHSDRKLIYIMPFVKGPEEAPFRPKLKVYEVTR